MRLLLAILFTFQIAWVQAAPSAEHHQLMRLEHKVKKKRPPRTRYIKKAFEESGEILPALIGVFFAFVFLGAEYWILRNVPFRGFWNIFLKSMAIGVLVMIIISVIYASLHRRYDVQPFI